MAWRITKVETNRKYTSINTEGPVLDILIVMEADDGTQFREVRVKPGLVQWTPFIEGIDHGASYAIFDKKSACSTIR